MLDIKSRKITGIPGTGGRSQVYEFTPQEADLGELRGRLFVVVALPKGDAVSIEKERRLVSKLEKEYFGNLDLKPFNALKNALEKSSEEFRNSGEEVEAAAFSFAGNVVYSSAVNGPQLIIFRNGSTGVVLKSLGEEIAQASGFPKEGDVMFLGTKDFFGRVSENFIKEALEAKDPEKAMSILEPKIAGGTGREAALIVYFGGQVFVPSTDFKKKFSLFLNNLVSKIPQKKIYIRSREDEEISSQGKKTTFSVAIGLIVILAVSIVFGIRQKKINAEKSRYQAILFSAEKEVNDAISLASVDLGKSRELFGDAEGKLDSIQSLKIKDPKVADLAKKIDDSRGVILGEYRQKPELFLDLSLLSSGFRGDALSVSGGSVFILDKTGKKIVSVNLSTKKSKVVAGPQVLDGAFDLASYEDRVFAVEGDGIYELGPAKNKVIDKTWGGEIFVKAFAGNMYVVDKSAGAIYRFSGNGNSFGAKQNWLSSDTKADFSGSLKVVIDGSIYVLFPGSKIQKFSLGSPQTFRISGVVPEIGQVDAIFAGENTTYVYLLDRAGKRVVVVDKKGNYKAQYKDDAIKEATNLVVSEADKKIILLSGDKLLSVEIKNLN